MKTFAERFWEKVNKDGPIHPALQTRCWIWTAAVSSTGYGQISRDGSLVFAHRASLEMSIGRPLGSLRALHRCDNPPCVRPEHLFAGTQSENLFDMHRKRRGQRGRPLKSQCIRGHDLTPENSYPRPGRARECRICMKARRRQTYLRTRTSTKPLIVEAL